MFDPRLYILMRTDMASMNPGKGMAQAAHAANAFVGDMEDFARNGPIEGSQHTQAFRAWAQQTAQNFGVTYTLAVPDEVTMENTVKMARMLHYPADVIFDPTYPVRDGLVTHLIPVYTCAYVFSPDGAPRFLSKFDLHP